MSSASIVCGEKWIKIPDLHTHCVQEVATVAVQEFNKKYGNSLKFDSIYAGLYWEISPCVVKYKLYIKALDFFGRLLNYLIIVHEETNQNKKIRIVESFTVIVTDGHFVGDISPPKEVKWIKIPNLCEPFIQVVAQFGLEELSKKIGDVLKYDSISEGRYGEVGQDSIQFHLFVKAKDNDGYVGIYHVIVLVQHSLTQKIKTLISFKITVVKETIVQVIIKFVEEELKKLDVLLIFVSLIKESSYIELGPNGLIRYHLVIKAKDIFGRLLYFELIVEKQGSIFKLVSIFVITTPGHCVGPTKPPSEKKWIKIPCLTIPFIHELAIFASKEIEIKSGESLKYDSIYEACYSELGGDDIEFRLLFNLKDCLGRVRKYEASVLVKHFFGITIKRVKIFISYKRLTGCGA